MDNNYYIDEFEQLLKEKADQFRMYPSKRVWHSIYNNMHPSRRWPSAAMSMFLIIALLFVGYLNTSDNTITNQFSINIDNQYINDPYNNNNAYTQKKAIADNKTQQLPNTGSEYIANAFISSESEISGYTEVKYDDPNATNVVAENYPKNEKNPADRQTTVNSDTPPGNITENADNVLIQATDTYIKTNQIFSDIAVANKNIKIQVSIPSIININQEELTDENENDLNKINTVKLTDNKKPVTITVNSPGPDKRINELKATIAKNDINPTSKSLSPEEKAWIENYALQNKPQQKKWKDKLALEFYVTPAVNYRKLTTKSKGSATAFATGDINNSISQKPGLGIETGLGLSYAIAKKLRFKAGIQFNYTNYNINADQTNHPILTTLLLNDPNTGYSYPASRTSTLSNAYNSSALQPVVIHNRTYQISIPVGLTYKLSSTNNVDWFAGATVQPTYVFGGKAHLISSDLKSYISDPSSIRNWNLNLGFETYMNYKLGTYNLQVGPQVRYQLFSTYRNNVALIEKQYAVGLKIGIVKGF